MCLQTLDGIISHDGEIHDQKLEPMIYKTFESLDKKILFKKENSDANLIPMTLEGCVVRMADTISYIGRDLEDAIRLGMIQRSEIPSKCTERLGNTNGTIVYNLVTDVIKNSYEKNYTAFSPEVSTALQALKAFNMEYIYLNPEIKKHLSIIRQLFEMLFDRYLNDLENENLSSVIFTQFLEDISEEYLTNHSHAEIVRDFIAGMTDQYFLRLCPEDLRPAYRTM